MNLFIHWALWGVINQDLRIMKLALKTLNLLLLLSWHGMSQNGPKEDKHPEGCWQAAHGVIKIYHMFVIMPIIKGTPQKYNRVFCEVVFPYQHLSQCCGGDHSVLVDQQTLTLTVFTVKGRNHDNHDKHITPRVIWNNHFPPVGISTKHHIHQNILDGRLTLSFSFTRHYSHNSISWVLTPLGLHLKWCNSLTLKVLNFWKFTSYCSLKPLWSGMGEVVPARTSPTLHPLPLCINCYD